MANALYVEYKNSILGAATHSFPDMNTDNIKSVLVDHGTDTPVPATDQDLADISAGVVATSGNMAGASISGGATRTPAWPAPRR